MANIDWAQLIPVAPLHWTTIIHYLIILGALFILIASQSDVSLVFIFILAGIAIVTGADMYSNLINFPRFVIFMLRVGMVGLPLIIAGIAPAEELRGLAIIMGALGFIIFAITFLTCFLPFLADPRIAHWCAIPAS